MVQFSQWAGSCDPAAPPTSALNVEDLQNKLATLPVNQEEEQEEEEEEEKEEEEGEPKDTGQTAGLFETDGTCLQRHNCEC